MDMLCICLDGGPPMTQFTHWLDDALKQPKRRQPTLRGVDSPLRPLHTAARQVYLARRMEAADRARHAAGRYTDTVADFHANMIAAQAFSAKN